MSKTNFSSGDWININDATDPTLFTLAARVNVASIADQMIIARTDSSEGTNYSHALKITSSGTFKNMVWVGSVSESNVSGLTTGWHTLVGTFEQNNQVQCFLDGVGGTAVASSGSFWPDGDHWIIGKNGWDISAFSGAIAWVGMWARILSQREITTLNKYHPRYVPRSHWLADLMGVTPIVHSDADIANSVTGTLGNADNPPILY